MGFVLALIGSIALALLFTAVWPLLRRCPKCKASGIETRDESNEFTGRTYRHWTCGACGHQWSRRLWLQTNNGVDEDRIEWSHPSETTSTPHDPFGHHGVSPPSSSNDSFGSSDDSFGGGSSGGGGAGSSW